MKLTTGVSVLHIPLLFHNLEVKREMYMMLRLWMIFSFFLVLSILFKFSTMNVQQFYYEKNTINILNSNSLYVARSALQLVIINSCKLHHIIR